MKYLCERCDTVMNFVGAQGPHEGSMRVTFACPRCDARISMLTNAQETQLVKSLGVTLGGKKASASPLELVRSSLVGKREPVLHPAVAGDSPSSDHPLKASIMWTEEAEMKLKNVPPMLVKMVKKVVENYAIENGCSVIDVEVIDKAKNKIGMVHWPHG